MKVSGFLYFKEGPGKKVLFSVVLLVLAAIITIVVHRGAFTGGAGLEIALKCSECGHTETVAQEQFQAMITKRNELYVEEVARQNLKLAEKLRQMMKDPTQENLEPLDRRRMQGVSLPSWGSPDWPLICTKCGNHSLYIARQCPRCGEIFSGFNESGRSIRTCPKCGCNLRSRN
jgi:rubrerythrin